jgi:hypothetical protein
MLLEGEDEEFRQQITRIASENMPATEAESP